MNILHLISKADPYDAIAGALDLIQHLNNEDHNSLIASSLDIEGLKSEKIDAKHYCLPNFENNIKDYFVAYKRLKEIIKVNAIDIVHTYSVLGSRLAFFACRHTHKPLVNTCYEFYPKNIRNQALFLNGRVIVHNEALGEYLAGNFNLPRNRLRFIKHGLDLDNFTFREVDQRSKTDFNIGMIAPFQSSKEYEYFLKAMVKVVRMVPPIKIWLISYASQFRHNVKDEIQVWVRRLGLAGYVKFFDTANLNLNFLSELNIFMFSAFAENANLRPILEAQACGVPVIATRVAGVADIIIDGQTGILVPPQDNNFLANATIQILKDFPLARSIAVAARKRIEEEFSLNDKITDLLDTYKKVKDNVRILAISAGKTQEVVSSIPSLRVLKEHWPKGQITSLVNPNSRCLLRRCPYIDEFIIYDRGSKHKGLQGFIHILKLLLKDKFDLVFNFDDSFSTRLLSYLCLASKRYGYIHNFWDKFMVNYGVKKPKKSMGLAKDKLQILSPLGIEPSDYKLELWPSPEDIDFAENFLRDSWVGKEKMVGMDISLNRKFLSDAKALDYLAYLCDKLANQQFRVMLVGLKGSINIKNELLKRLKSKPILASGDISSIQIACLMKKCDVYISLNQESQYLALAMNTPSIILSSKKNNFDLAKYKNIQLLPAKEFSQGIQDRNSKSASKQPARKDSVIEAVNKLINNK